MSYPQDPGQGYGGWGQPPPAPPAWNQPPGGYPPGYLGSGGGPGGGFGGEGKATEQMALASMITGIVSLPSAFCCSFFGIPLSICAIVLGIIAIGKINKEPDRWEGKGMAIAGIATGAVGFLLFFVLFAVGIAGALLNKM